MKRILTFFFALFAFMGTWAEPVLPHFSSATLGEWYYVRFKVGGAFLTDQGSGQNLRTAVAAFERSQKWQLVGNNTDGFVMRNQNGNYVNYSSMFVANATEGAKLKLVQSTHNSYKDYWEIQRVGGKYMNQWGGAGGPGKDLGEWNLGTDNNALEFIPVKQLDVLAPEFSTVEAPVWYRVKFTTDGAFLGDLGAGNNLQTKGDDVKDVNQQWQLIGKPSQFQLRSRSGHYVNITGTGNDTRYTANTTGINLSLYLKKDNSGWSIGRGNSKGMNQWAGTGVGKDIGDYDVENGNNALTFQKLDILKNLPDFSTEAEPIYYHIQFAGGAFMKDMGNDSIMKTANKDNSNEEKWQFIGTEYGFKLKNMAGRYVYYEGSRFKTTNKENMAANLEFVQFSDGRSLQIKEVKDAANGKVYMNQVGGQGAGKALGKWDNNDPNNGLNVILFSLSLPQFSATVDAENPTWYFIQFKNGGAAIKDMGIDVSARTQKEEPADAQLWKLVGTKENFQMVNKLNHYLVVSNQRETNTGAGPNENPLRTSATSYDKGFSLVASENETYAPAWEIHPNDSKFDGKNLNQHGGAGVNKTLGFWNLNDPNNPLIFVAEDNVEYPDFLYTSKENYQPVHDLSLWYNIPSTVAPTFPAGRGYGTWMEYALPLGDGQLGATFMGGIAEDEIFLNEKTVWSGTKDDRGGYGKYEVFGVYRAKYLGDDLGYTADKTAKNYLRQLDLTTATGLVSFENQAGVKYEREYLVSNKANVLAIRYTATNGGKLNYLFSLDGGKAGDKGVNAPTTYTGMEANFADKLQTVRYDARMKVLNLGNEGLVITSDEGIEVRGAKEIVVLITGTTDFDQKYSTYVDSSLDLAKKVQARINDAETTITANEGWKTFVDAHVAAHKKFFDRVDFQLGTTQNVMPTNELIDSYNSGNGTHALMLEKLYFAYGRYLEIASSQGVDLPNNLQGIWNALAWPSWNSDIHANINVQMNYWPAEPTNLSETHEPFLNYIIKMAESDQWKNFANLANPDKHEGWTCYTENNIFGGVGTFQTNYVIANAWYCTHLWQHYRYTLDEAYLEKAFPAMWTASRFWINRLKKLELGEGKYEYVCPQEYSPEHGPGKEDGVAHAQQLVWDLLDNTYQAAQILGAKAKVDASLLATHKERLDHLDKGLATEIYDGNWGTDRIPANTPILREWKTSSYKAGSHDHRHMSHLMCLYPFSQVEPGSALHTAAVNSLKLRGDGATGWSMGWKINLWARALDGDHSRKILSNALKHANASSGVYYNLFDAHDPFQIDGNFGACSGIAEMVMQSNEGIIRILPALPSKWTEGHMHGLKAVGNFKVDIDWKNKVATKAVITSVKGQYLKLNAKDIAKVQVLVNNVEVAPKVVNADNIELPTQVDDVVEINFNVKKAKGSFDIKTAEGFGTIYVDHAFVMPENVKGSTVTGVTPGADQVGTLNTAWEYTSGKTVPAQTALVLKGKTGHYVYEVAKENVAASTSNNLLKGRLTDGLTENEAKTKYYKLTYSMENNVKTLGFFWGAENGAAFKTGAGKAYLAVPEATAAQVRGYRLSDEVTGIEGVETTEEGAPAIYSLAGVRMNVEFNELPKGVYIVNGKKVIIK